MPEWKKEGAQLIDRSSSGRSAATTNRSRWSPTRTLAKLELFPEHPSTFDRRREIYADLLGASLHWELRHECGHTPVTQYSRLLSGWDHNGHVPHSWCNAVVSKACLNHKDSRATQVARSPLSILFAHFAARQDTPALLERAHLRDHSLVRAPAEPFSRPGRSLTAPARAAGRQGWSAAPRRRGSLDGREHDGTLMRIGAP